MKMKDIKGNMDTNVTEEFSVTDNNHLTKADDKYMDSIDLSNACREFYQTRKRAAEVVKEKLANSGRPRTCRKTTSIDVAMETLRTEMASLMDQDLSLMKQLLTLNETIEDLKWQKKYYHSQSSLPDSSCDLSRSDLSISDTDMYESENEVLRKYPTSSPVSVHSVKDIESRRSCRAEIADLESDSFEKSQIDLYECPSIDTTLLTEDFQRFLVGSCCHEEQNSFDSGIHEPAIRKQIPV
ncbi:uncharacterized protein LOC123525467 [Mercenaria mercenaria]|uniref:uncharacterized protein LOC123525467 n=1 Tax=Mercenaria mercenaria TaxID=6596 RepID=UPI00234ED6D9|nr:uncharacterized protein LOC123525467 [Mercenaria mercenaria]